MIMIRLPANPPAMLFSGQRINDLRENAAEARKERQLAQEARQRERAAKKAQEAREKQISRQTRERIRNS